jgi:aryl-alcohol dehydrogenase-like predicted oxidoreductase
MKLGLGTAQLDPAYGVARTRGPVDVDALLEAAAACGVSCLDTAPAYGEAESLLGRALPPDHGFRIVTKTPVFRRALRHDVGAEVEAAAHRSLERLCQSRLDGLLVHDAEDLLADGGEAIFDALGELKATGLVSGIGVSVYDASQIDRVLERFRIDVIQLPFGPLDQRLVQSGHLEKMKSSGIEVHARSLFLQGLLLVEPERLPEPLAPLRPALAERRRWAAALGTTPAAAALGFARACGLVDVAICGVDSPVQLHELGEAIGQPPVEARWSDWALDDARWLDPRRWNDTGGSR